MEEYLRISVEIFPKERIVYIAEESASGGEYKFSNIKELAKQVQFYLENYYKSQIEGE